MGHQCQYINSNQGDRQDICTCNNVLKRTLFESVGKRVWLDSERRSYPGTRNANEQCAINSN